jgi:DNA-binding MarR family transcriptional regulator
MDFQEITLTLTTVQARALADSIDWSMQATERSIEERGRSKERTAKWEALDDILAQLQEVKRDRWFGTRAA